MRHSYYFEGDSFKDAYGKDIDFVARGGYCLSCYDLVVEDDIVQRPLYIGNAGVVMCKECIEDSDHHTWETYTKICSI